MTQAEMTTLRGYELLEQAGAGAFASVWRGRQPSVDRIVAIKEIRSELVNQPAFIRQFEAEAHLVARLEHPHVVPLIDYWRDPESAYLVMRWLNGGTAEAALDEGRFTTERCLRLVQQIGGALAAAHAAGVVHRDVKPANIMLDDGDNFFLTDFGIALEVDETTGPAAALSHGTPAYASPEQLRHERLDARADVFSLGVAVFECLAGRLPYDLSLEPAELLRKQLYEDLPPIDELRPGISTETSIVLARATEKRPEDRYGSVAAFAEELSVVLGAPAPIRSSSGASTAVAGEVVNPYRGLRAFDEADVGVFCGREKLVTNLVDRLAGPGTSSRGILLVGPSGSGKSSVARAGLIPALRAGGVSGSEDWFVATMVPGPDPWEALEVALLRIASNPPEHLVGQLRDGPRGISRGVKRCLPGDDDVAVVVVDQLEELFTQCSLEDQRLFLDGLAHAVRDPRSQLRLVATIRADFYDRPLRHQGFAALLDQIAVDVPPLDGDELERAIATPAERVGVSLEPGLVATISADCIYQPSALPSLQHLMAELFERRSGATLTLDAYYSLGGIAGAVAARAEELCDTGSPERLDATRRLFGRLASVDSTGAPTRRRITYGDSVLDEETAAVVEDFAAARLLTLGRDATTREPTIEVAHEALLTAWPRLTTWLEEDRELNAEVADLAQRADAWEEGGRPRDELLRGARLERGLALRADAPDRLRPLDHAYSEESDHAHLADRRGDQRRVRRLRTLLSVAVVALLVASVAGVAALRQAHRADQAATSADQRADEAEIATLISRSASLASTNSRAALQLAVEAHRRDPGPATERAVLGALVAQQQVLAEIPADAEGTACAPFPVDVGQGGLTLGGPQTELDSQGSVMTRLGPVPLPCQGGLAVESEPPFEVTMSDGKVWFAEPGQPFGDPFPLDEVRGGIWSPGEVPRALVFPFNLALTSGRGVLVDPLSGEEIGPGWDDPFSPVPAFSDDGELLALARSTVYGLDGTGVISVHRSADGAELFRIDTDRRAFVLHFDDARQELVAGLSDGSLLTIDVAEQAVTSEVSSGVDDEIVGFGVRDDGTLAVATRGQLFLVDRQTGQLPGTAIEVDEVTWGATGEGDTFAIGHPDGSLTIYDLSGGAMVQQSYAAPGNNRVTISSGQAAVSALTRDKSEIIDLATGERRTAGLEMPDGSTFPSLATIPREGGHLAIDIDGRVAQWRGGALVKVLDLGFPEGTVLGSGDGADGLLALSSVAADDSGGIHVVDVDQLTETLPPIELPLAPIGVHTALDGGVYAFFETTMTHFGSDGEEISTFEIPATGSAGVAVDPSSGAVAIGGPGGAAIIDPDGTVTEIPDSGETAGLAFAGEGEQLVIAAEDGSARLWDVDEQRSAGVLWQGTGTSTGDPRYEEATDSVWVPSAGRLVRLPLDPEQWLRIACGLAGGDLTDEEWERFGAGDEPSTSACAAYR